MKKKLLFIGSVVILIFAAITFVFIPAMSDGFAQKALVFGKYGNKKIEYKPGTEFSNAVSNYTEMFRNQGTELNDYSYFYIYNYAFNSAVQAIAYAESVKKSGYAPSAGAVSRAMLPYFLDDNGNYSKEFYQSVPKEEINNLKVQLTNGLVWNRYSEDLLGSQKPVAGNRLFGLKVSENELNFIGNMGARKRSFDMAVFKKSNYPDSEVKSFGQENSEKFVKYNLSLISVKELSQAKKLLRQLQNEEIAFADAINEYSDKAYTEADGFLSSSFGYQIKEISKDEKAYNEIVSLGQDQVSGIIEINSGYGIFRSNLPPVQPDFNDSSMVDTVRTYISENEASKIEDFYIASAKEFASAASSKSFSSACSDFNCDYVSVPSFCLNYDSSSMFDGIPSHIPELSSAASNENFLQKAFALKAGEVSEPVVLGDNILVLKLTGEQNDVVTDDKKDSIRTKIDDFDSSASQSTLLASKKVENRVSEVFFNDIMKNN